MIYLKILGEGLQPFPAAARNAAFFLISSMVLGLLNQLQIFWQLYLIELLGLLTQLGLLEL